MNMLDTDIIALQRQEDQQQKSPASASRIFTAAAPPTPADGTTANNKQKAATSSSLPASLRTQMAAASRTSEAGAEAAAISKQPSFFSYYRNRKNNNNLSKSGISGKVFKRKVSSRATAYQRQQQMQMLPHSKSFPPQQQQARGKSVSWGAAVAEHQQEPQVAQGRREGKERGTRQERSTTTSSAPAVTKTSSSTPSERCFPDLNKKKKGGGAVPGGGAVEGPNRSSRSSGGIDGELERKNLNVSAGMVFYERAKSRRMRHRDILRKLVLDDDGDNGKASSGNNDSVVGIVSAPHAVAIPLGRKRSGGGGCDSTSGARGPGTAVLVTRGGVGGSGGGSMDDFDEEFALKGRFRASRISAAVASATNPPARRCLSDSHRRRLINTGPGSLPAASTGSSTPSGYTNKHDTGLKRPVSLQPSRHSKNCDSVSIRRSINSRSTDGSRNTGGRNTANATGTDHQMAATGITEPQPTPYQFQFLGRRVAKYFYPDDDSVNDADCHDRLYFGVVQSIDTVDDDDSGSGKAANSLSRFDVRLFPFVRYDDGDKEHMTWSELEKCLELYEAKKEKDNNRGAVKKMTAVATGKKKEKMKNTMERKRKREQQPQPLPRGVIRGGSETGNKKGRHRILHATKRGKINK